MFAGLASHTQKIILAEA